MMPHNLDISLASATHGASLLSPRNGPGMSLRRVASYNSLEKGPDSATSSSFTINHLYYSPPPSPGLPALVTRHGRTEPKRVGRRILRFLSWLFGVMTVLWFAFKQIQANQPLPNAGWSNEDAENYEMIGEDVLPDFPTPVVVTDKRGRAKWTVSIPSDWDFPLAPETYTDICKSAKEASDHVADLHSHKKSTYRAHLAYYHVDPYFMDVKEAVELVMLPKPGQATLKGGFSAPGSSGEIVGEQDEQLIEGDVCERTLTFVMETGNAGMGETLMMLWMAYGLAQKEGRSFFVDDSRWAYGKYATYFAPPPLSKCRPPPRTEILPCPHHARHLLVSAATSPWTFGGQFEDAYEDPRKVDVFRLEQTFALARSGYEALFALAGNDGIYVEQRVAEFRNQTSISADTQNGMVIGIHIRHGDRHPLDFMYQDAYTPTNKYAEEARELLYDTYNKTNQYATASSAAEQASLFVLSSDDPDVYESQEFVHAKRAQDLILLAKKEPVVAVPTLTLKDLVADDNQLHISDVDATLFKRFEAQSIGWEGGFYAGMFWSLGMGNAGVLTHDDMTRSQKSPSYEAMRLREVVGRAYLMDLTVLGQGSDAIVCGVASMTCRLLAVMLGWENAVVQGAWKNVDGEFSWKGLSW